MIGLDLYCGQGGATKGYELAGHRMYGVDTFRTFKPSRYPATSRRGHALLIMKTLLAGEAVRFGSERLLLSDFGFIHASPPCQHATAGTRALRAQGGYYPKLISQTRELLIESGMPYIIENVTGADLIDPVLLCGAMFNLTAEDEDGVLLYLQRHRMFETNFPLEVPEHRHVEGVQWAGVYAGARSRKAGQTAAEHRDSARDERKGGYVPGSMKVRQRLLGVDWMTATGMEQCIPPAYAEWVGRQIHL